MPTRVSKRTPAKRGRKVKQGKVIVINVRVRCWEHEYPQAYAALIDAAPGETPTLFLSALEGLKVRKKASKPESVSNDRQIILLDD